MQTSPDFDSRRAGTPQRHWATWLFAAALVAGCGGGGGGSGSPTEVAAAFVQGPITGFGSVIVNGVAFDDTAADVSDDDGAVHSRGELKLGMQVEVEATALDAAKTAAKAMHIRFGSEIIGPATDIDVAGGTFKVLSQKIVVSPTTVFGDSLAGGLAKLPKDAVVEVHAQFDAANSQYLATRIEAKPSAAFYKLRGVVSALGTDTKGRKIFNIGDAVINYNDIATADLPPNLANGLKVRVRLNTTQNADGQWVAVTIRSGVRKVEDHDEAEVRGTIDNFTSTEKFSVNGLAVNATSAAFPDGKVGVTLGAKVEVEGTVKDGTLIARKVELEDHHANDDRHGMELRGQVSALAADKTSFMLRGVKVTVDLATIVFRNGTAADLIEGARVEVKGVVGSDRNTVAATRIAFVR